MSAPAPRAGPLADGSSPRREGVAPPPFASAGRPPAYAALRPGGVRGTDARRSAARGMRLVAGVAVSPVALASALAAVLAGVYLLVAPPAADLGAAIYRANLFAHAGFTLWDNGWYAGQSVLPYSILSPPLSALLGVRALLAIATVASSALFAALARRVLEPGAALAAALWFALGMSAELLAGRVPYVLGVALGIASLLALVSRRPRPAAALAALCSLASPVAGAFLALAGAAQALSAARARGGLGALLRRRGQQPRTAPRRGGGTALPAAPATARKRPREAPRAMVPALGVVAFALAPILLLAIAFPSSGYEPFAFSDFLPQLAAALGVLLLIPRRWQALRSGGALYALVLLAAFAIHTPMGSNAERLGSLLGGPLAAAALWQRRRALLALLAPALLYWQLAGPVRDLVKLLPDRSTHASYYAPLAGELAKLTAGAPARIEVPMLGSHMEGALLALAGRPAPGSSGSSPLDIVLARGWERQLDTATAPLFYTSQLTAAAYRSWLYANGVSYVALPDARLDYSSLQEASLIRHGLPYLREVWRSAHWRLFATQPAATLAQRPARLTHLGTASFTLRVPRPGRYLVRVRYSPYYAPASGHGCIARAPGGFTSVDAPAAGPLRVGIDFSLSRVFASGPRCG
jgi:hypothetical protein